MIDIRSTFSCGIKVDWSHCSLSLAYISTTKSKLTVFRQIVKQKTLGKAGDWQPSSM